MTQEGTTSVWLCRECGRENRPPEPRCWFCSAPRPGATGIAAAPGPARRPPAELDEDYPQPAWLSPFYWKLPTLTANILLSLCVLLIPVCGVGLALLLALAPALVRLFRIARERRPGLPVLPLEAVSHGFALTAAAIGIALLVVVSSLITFVGVCSSTGAYAISDLGNSHPLLGVVVWIAGFVGGLTAAGGLGYGILYAFFHRQKRE